MSFEEKVLNVVNIIEQKELILKKATLKQIGIRNRLEGEEETRAKKQQELKMLSIEKKRDFERLSF